MCLFAKFAVLLDASEVLEAVFFNLAGLDMINR